VNKGLTSDAMGEGVDDIDISDIQDLFSPLPPYHSHHQKKPTYFYKKVYIKLQTLGMYLSKRYYIDCAKI
jgi:hypothetical protein